VSGEFNPSKIRVGPSPIRIRPQPGGGVQIEGPVLVEEPERSNPTPPFGLRLRRRGETVAALEQHEIEPTKAAETLSEWIQENAEAGDQLDVSFGVESVTIAELGPFLDTGHQHGIHIDVLFGTDA